MNPLSICIPSYNYANYLGEAIQSCLKENFEFELIILDNCSNDETPKLKDIFTHDSRVKWYRNNKVLPVQQNWNKAVSLCSGKYVKLLQADDYLLPNFFPVFYNQIENKAPHGIFGHLAIMINHEGKTIRKQMPYGNLNEYSVIDEEALKLKMRHVARFKEPTCNFFLKEAWNKIGGYRIDMRFTFDVAFNIRVAHLLGGKLINEYCAAIRRHSRSDGAKLPPSLAIQELEKLVFEMLSTLDAHCTQSDRNAGLSMIQYRIIELFLQRFSSNPLASIRFFYSNIHYFKNLYSIKETLMSLVRKIKFGDVQNNYEKVWPKLT